MRYSIQVSTIFLLITITLSLFSPQPLYAASEPLIPGVSCGVADSTSATACCLSDEDVPSDKSAGVIETVTSKVPGLGMIGDALKSRRELNNEINETKRSYANKNKCLTGEEQFDGSSGKCTCIDKKTDDAGAVAKMCKSHLVSSDKKNVEEERLACVKCAQEGGYWSSLGCIPLSLGELVSQVVLTVGIGLGGFIAVLCITINALRLQISRGDSTAIQKIRENITSCILGLLLILFSVFILRLVDISIFGGILGG